MNESEHRFVSFDKTVIFYRRTEPAQPEKAALLILHGMGEHGGRYRELAAFLGQKGITCFIPDLRGFGKSGGKRGCLGEFSDYYKDLEVVYRAAHPAPSAAAPKPTTTGAATHPVGAKLNLNTATVAELDKAPQIGPTRSKAIVEARAKEKFKNWDDFVARKVIPADAAAAMKDVVSF